MKTLFILFFILGCNKALAQSAPLEPPYTTPSGTSSSLPPIPDPTEIDDEGTYFYGDEPARDAIHYEIDARPPIKGAMFLRFGVMGPYEIEPVTGRTYENIYTTKSSFVAVFEYEWQLGHLLGKWTLKAGTGITTEDGRGQFASATTFTPKEKFLFIVMPNTALLNYKMRFSDNQWFIPYVEGGAGYFTFWESRTDGGRNAFGGAAVAAVAGGMLISMSLLEKNGASIFYEDYGVSHLWFDLQFRRNIGLNDEIDFSSNMITAGFGFGF